MKFADCFTPLTPFSAKAIKDAGFAGVCRYLGAKTHASWGKGLTPLEVAIATAADLLIVSNWEGNSTYPGYFTAEQARQDAADAFVEARWIGQPLQTAIYFSVDYDAQPADFPAVAAYFRTIYENLGAHYSIRAYAKAALLEYLTTHCPFLGPSWEPAAWDNSVVLPGIALFQDRYGVALRGGIEVDEDIVKSSDVGYWPVKGVNALKYGDSGDQVKQLQAQLNQALHTKIAEDGKYGPTTEAAVKSFQQINKLPVTGTADGNTVAAIKSIVEAQQRTAQAAAEKVEADKKQQALDLIVKGTAMIAQGTDIIKSL